MVPPPFPMATLMGELSQELNDSDSTMTPPTDPMLPTPGSMMSPEVVAPTQAHLSDYYHDISTIQTATNCLSLVLLVTALVFWSVICHHDRYGHPYRCVTFVVALVFSLVVHLVGLVSAVVATLPSATCHALLAVRSYADLGMYSFLFLYVLACIGIAMRRLESGTKFYSLVLVALVLPLVLVAATTCVRLLLHPDHAPCDLLHLPSHHLWYDRAPRCFLLFGTICVLSVLLYWLFCFDNSMFKLNRDFLLIRHSSVTVMVLTSFCFFLELYQVVYLSHAPHGHIRSQGVARSGLILTVLICAKGAAAAFLMCFLDLEVLCLVHAFPCCPDLHTTVADQTWERRIRSESKVKFFEDSSSSSDDNRGKTSSGGGEDTKEKDRVLPRVTPKATSNYGAVGTDGGHT